MGKPRVFVAVTIAPHCAQRLSDRPAEIDDMLLVKNKWVR